MIEVTDVDHTYCPRITEDGIVVDRNPIQFNDDGQIIIEEVHYRQTPGLYELLFKRIPKLRCFNDADLDLYKDLYKDEYSQA